MLSNSSRKSSSSSKNGWRLILVGDAVVVVPMSALVLMAVAVGTS